MSETHFSCLSIKALYSRFHQKAPACLLMNIFFLHPKEVINFNCSVFFVHKIIRHKNSTTFTIMRKVFEIVVRH